MEINFFFEGIEKFILNNNINRKIEKIVHDENYRTAELNFIFCSDEHILKINKKYLNHDYYTDVISFNYNEKSKLAGDIFISRDTVLYNAEKYNQSFDNEIQRVMIHGVLHLAGYNDISNEEKAVMKLKEDEYLNS